MAMSPSGRKAKGKKYEEKIANILHEMFMEHHKPYRALFEQVGNDELRPKRDFASGNMGGSHGDINLNLMKPFFPYSMECKHWASLDLSLNSMIKESIKSLKDVYDLQCVPKAFECGLTPLVVFSANRTKQFCMLQMSFDNIGHPLYEYLRAQMIPFVFTSGFYILEFQEFVNYAMFVDQHVTKS
jgi:hypothetical protein